MFRNILKPIVAAAGLAALLLASAALAQEATPESAVNRLDRLMQELSAAEPKDARRLEDEIRLEWDRSGSASANLLLDRGRKAFDAGNVQSAIEHYTALTDHAPDFAEGWVERARAFFELQQFGPALSDLETALALNPNHFEAISGLGLIFETMNRPQEAYQAYTLVRSIHPNHPAVTEALERLEPVVKGQAL